MGRGRIYLATFIFSEKVEEVFNRWFLHCKKSFDKRKLHGRNKNDLAVFAAETKRAELTHWFLMIPAPLFFLWNPAWAGWLMIVYAILVNVPFIIVRRYNRGRLEAIIL